MAFQPLPVTVGTDIELVCIIIEGDVSHYYIAWVFEDARSVLYTGNETTGGNFTFTISESSYGLYRCFVQNRFGFHDSFIEIQQAGMH